MDEDTWDEKTERKQRYGRKKFKKEKKDHEPKIRSDVRKKPRRRNWDVDTWEDEEDFDD